MARPCASLARRRLMWRSVLLGAVIASALPVVACRKQPARDPPPPPAPPPPLSEFCVSAPRRRPESSTVAHSIGAATWTSPDTRVEPAGGHHRPTIARIRNSREVRNDCRRVDCGCTGVAAQPIKARAAQTRAAEIEWWSTHCFGKMIPRLVGLDLQGAVAMLERLNLRVGRVLYNESTTSRPNVILAQRLDPGLIVPCQTEIAVLVAAPPRKAPAQIRAPSHSAAIVLAPVRRLKQSACGWVRSCKTTPGEVPVLCSTNHRRQAHRWHSEQPSPCG